MQNNFLNIVLTATSAFSISISEMMVKTILKKKIQNFRDQNKSSKKVETKLVAGPKRKDKNIFSLFFPYNSLLGECHFYYPYVFNLNSFLRYSFYNFFKMEFLDNLLNFMFTINITFC